MKILIADDDPVSRLYLADALEEWGYEVVTSIDGDSACARLLEPGGPMLAILDWMMPGMDGIDVCRAVRAAALEHYTYMLVLTSRSQTEHIVEAMTAGADDFIAKPFNADELRVRVRAGRRMCEMEAALRRKATQDALTGIFNRGAVYAILERELGRSQREQAPLSILFADLDHFKRTNDQYGHQAGDAVLCEVTRRIAAVLRPYDTLGRYGGEELLVVLPACDARGAGIVAERIRRCLEPAIATEAGSIATTVSVGTATAVPGWAIGVDALVQRADAALYRAKANGRNRVEADLGA